MKSKFFRWLLVLVWMSVIFYLSSVPDLGSGFPKLEDTILRKIAHLGEYGFLALLVAWAWDKKKHWLLFSVFLCVAYAASDEIHQLFIRDRSGQLIDVVIDTIGIVIGLWLYTRISTNKKTSHSAQD